MGGPEDEIESSQEQLEAQIDVDLQGRGEYAEDWRVTLDNWLIFAKLFAEKGIQQHETQVQ